jgi:hypothetical protein
MLSKAPNVESLVPRMELLGSNGTFEKQDFGDTQNFECMF